MAIEKKDVEHIARLARINLSEEEKEKLEKELSGILDFVSELNEVDTEGVQPMTGGTNLVNVMRSDSIVEDSLEESGFDLVSQAPEKKDSWITVRSIFN